MRFGTIFRDFSHKYCMFNVALVRMYLEQNAIVIYTVLYIVEILQSDYNVEMLFNFYLALCVSCS